MPVPAARGSVILIPRVGFADHVAMGRDVAPVVAAEVLIRHGLDDVRIGEYLARTWSLDDIDCMAAVRAAHVLVEREHPRPAGGGVAP